MTEHIEAISRLSRDLVKAAQTMSKSEARFLVDAYYIMQEDRKRGNAQVNSMMLEPHSILTWLTDQSATLEGQIKRALDAYANSTKVGEWLNSITGIGPVISAGLLAYTNLEKCPSYGALHAFAGLANVKWEKGQKRPWNARLKTICWHAGRGFMFNSNREGCFYGELYKKRKALEIERNERGDFAARAEADAKRYGKTTEAFKHASAGRLPPAHIDARARRYVVKLFLAHYYQVLVWAETGKMPPVPYPFIYLPHAHTEFLYPPGLGEYFPEFDSALRVYMPRAIREARETFSPSSAR